MQQNIPWVEKYRPRTMDEIVLPKRIKDKFNDGLYNNFIFQGVQGVGKTTLGMILAGKRSFKKINASDDSGIETVRNEIKNYMSVSSLKGDGKKVLMLDEADSLTSKAQEAMRGTIEYFVKNGYFLMTCNFPEKIMAAIKSRFEIIDFRFKPEEDQEMIRGIYARLVHIGKNEGLTFTQDGLVQLVKNSYPDIRSMITNLQGIAKNTKEITLESVSNQIVSTIDNDLFNFVVTEFEPAKIFAYIKSRFMNKEHEAYQLLGTPFCNWLNDNGKAGKVGVTAKIVHKYALESQGVPDKLLSLCACMYELTQAHK